MYPLWWFLLVFHPIGLPGKGSATAKAILPVKCTRDITFVPFCLKVMVPLIRTLVTGLLLMTLSGIIWLIPEYGFSPIMIVKLVSAGALWIIGFLIINITESRFLRLAPARGEKPSEVFIQIQKKHLALEVIGTLLFYIVLLRGVIF